MLTQKLFHIIKMQPWGQVKNNNLRVAIGVNAFHNWNNMGHQGHYLNNMYLHYTPDGDFVLGISDLAANESTFSPPLKSYPLEVNRLLRLELSTDHAWSLRGTPPLLTFHLRSCPSV